MAFGALGLFYISIRRFYRRVDISSHQIFTARLKTTSATVVSTDAIDAYLMAMAELNKK